MKNIDLVFEEIEGSAVGCSALSELSCWNTCGVKKENGDVAPFMDLEFEEINVGDVVGQDFTFHPTIYGCFLTAYCNVITCGEYLDIQVGSLQY